ncbi:hypothetical protein [Aliikangiella sp. G2MR2-5]|uniref:hypothetical protein n=1 Tax=Aliikangiella sp. G2MR2-5 TaxID=2788943 RepID=UPI0018AC0D16|nr:hypothetical protein [Aliikangiella sp. G2MR2-5]
MKYLTKTVLATVFGALAFASFSAIASEKEPHQVLININKTNNEDAVVDLKVDGESDSFDLPELNVGESKTFTTQSGKSVVATKTENGYKINVEGKELDIPVFTGKLGAKLHKSMPFQGIHEDVVTITGIELDENQKQIIRDAFVAAGVNKKVKFNNKHIMVFSSNDVKIDGDHKAIEWHSNNGDFEVIVNTDGEEEVRLHKIITIEEKED